MNLKTFYPPYAVNRIAQLRFEAANPWAPWLTAAAITALQDLLKPSDVGFEFGSGRSTVWLARRVRFLHSVEHLPKWYEHVQNELRRAHLSERVSHELATEAAGMEEDAVADNHCYLNRLTKMPQEHLDFVLVDGIMRLKCMQLAIPRLKRGGLLILDNANRYMPNKYQEGYTTVSERRSTAKDAGWGRVWTELSGWRNFNATDRIWDTRFWFKP